MTVVVRYSRQDGACGPRRARAGEGTRRPLPMAASVTATEPGGPMLGRPGVEHRELAESRWIRTSVPAARRPIGAADTAAGWG